MDVFFIQTNLDLLKLFYALADLEEKKLVTKKFAKKEIIITKRIMSSTKISSKVHKSSLHKIAISNLIHTRQLKKAIEDKIQNFENHKTWTYNNYLIIRRH